MANTVLCSLASTNYIDLSFMCYNHSYQITHCGEVCCTLSAVCLCSCAKSFPCISIYQSRSQVSGTTSRYCLIYKPLLLLCNPFWLCSLHSQKSLLLPPFVALPLVFQQILIELLIYSVCASRCWFHAAVCQSHSWVHMTSTSKIVNCQLIVISVSPISARYLVAAQ